MPSIERSRELAIRIAGATHSLRVYGAKGESWNRVVAGLRDRILEDIGSGASEVSLGLLGEGIAVCGVPLHAPPDSVVRFIDQLRQRNIEIVSFMPDLAASELEVLITFLTSDGEDVAGVHADQWLSDRGVRNIKIKHLSLERGRRTAHSFQDVVHRGADALDGEFRQVMSRGKVSASMIAQLAGELTELVLDLDAPMSTLIAMRDRQDYSVVHSVNVGLIAGSQAAALGLPEAQVREINQAGLLHDIGKTRVPEAILQKSGALSDGEREILDRHTVEGAKILMESGGLEGVIPIVAFSHHRRYGADSLVATELVRIADMFDSIRTLRPSEDAAAAKGAAAFMVLQGGGSMNIYLLERFATACGLFARGDMGRLTTGELVRVLMLHPDLALHPTVEVLEVGHHGGIKAGQVIDLAAPPAGLENAFLIPELPASLKDLRPAELDALG